MNRSETAAPGNLSSRTERTRKDSFQFNDIRLDMDRLCSANRSSRVDFVRLVSSADCPVLVQISPTFSLTTPRTPQLQQLSAT
jgi:hypothetical protein